MIVYDGKQVKEIFEFDEAIQHMRDSYQWMKSQYENMQTQLSNWNKDEEIEKYRDQTRYLRSHSLCELSDKELQAKKDFMDKHWKKCAEPLNNKVAGNTYIYEITGVGIGTIIKIKCPICGESKDITDTSSW